MFKKIKTALRDAKNYFFPQFRFPVFLFLGVLAIAELIKTLPVITINAGEHGLIIFRSDLKLLLMAAAFTILFIHHLSFCINKFKCCRAIKDSGIESEEEMDVKIYELNLGELKGKALSNLLRNAKKEMEKRNATKNN